MAFYYSQYRLVLVKPAHGILLPPTPQSGSSLVCLLPHFNPHHSSKDAPLISPKHQSKTNPRTLPHTQGPTVPPPLRPRQSHRWAAITEKRSRTNTPKYPRAISRTPSITASPP
ncbi:hypothetical protein HPP92_007444 [Vanilla planifolia]|uniref:Uncharacterized protein n=1 Tax=Vanilla planifolia TaxID=51239 RepID=A0A835RE46_VANPL|nr:hypothetical protein HPP92_007628 [Vanilla planifolia]KAG0490581.1 hypothetical protein HPP92_007444 [Vanilla planifolia]